MQSGIFSVALFSGLQVCPPGYILSLAQGIACQDSLADWVDTLGDNCNEYIMPKADGSSRCDSAHLLSDGKGVDAMACCICGVGNARSGSCSSCRAGTYSISPLAQASFVSRHGRQPVLPAMSHRRRLHLRS